MANLRKIGAEGEAAAARFLEGQGYSILERNFSTKFGEIDLIAREKNTLVFVEVKTRSSEEFGRPFDAVDQKKRRLIIRGAMKWLHLLGMPDITFRFDVVEVLTAPPGEVRIIENAFQLPDDYSY